MFGIFLAACLIYGPSILYTRAIERRRRREAGELEDRLVTFNSRLDSLQKQVRELQIRPPQPGTISPPPVGTEKQAPIPPPLAVPAMPSKPITPSIAVPTKPVTPIHTEVAKTPEPKPVSISKPPIPAQLSSSTALSSTTLPPKPPAPSMAPPPIAAPPATRAATGDVRMPSMASQTAKSPVAAYRQPLQSPSEKRFTFSMEEMIGTNWLPKLGVTIMFIGLVTWIASQWQSIPPVGRIALFYLWGGAMVGLGIWFEKRERYLTLGRSLIGGGWAVVFFTTYAMHHVEAARIIDSLEIDLALMVAVAGVMVWHTLRYDSQVVTGMAFLLGFFSVTQSHESVYSLAAGVILAVGLAVIVLRRQWYELEIFGILATFLNHLVWLYPIIEPMQREFGHNVPFPAFPASVTVLFAYWIIFRTTYVVRKITDEAQESLSTVAAILNSFLLLGVMKYQSVRPELAFYALLVLGAIELTLGQLSVIRKRRTAFLVLSTLGSCLLIGAFPFKFSGSPLAIFWLIGSQAFLFSGIFNREPLFRRVGVLTAMLVTGYEIVMQGLPVIEPMFEQWGAPRVADAQKSLLFGMTALVLYLDAVWVRRRWNDLFHIEFDTVSVRALSYLGAVSGVAAVYIYVPAAWVAVSIAAFGSTLAILCSRLDSEDLHYQAHVLSALAFLDVMLSNGGLDTWVRSATFLAVAALIYLSAWLALKAPRAAAVGGEAISQIHTWLGAALLTVLISYEAREWRMTVVWCALAILLGGIGTWRDRSDLRWQALAVAVLTFSRTLWVNLQTQTLWPGTRISIRLVTVPLVAAGMYLLCAWPPRKELRSVYTWGGTILMAALALQEAPDQWVAVLWVAMAMALAFTARRFEMRSLLWQAHLLSVLALVRVMLVNFDEPFHGTRSQLLTVGIVAASMYALSQLTKIEALLESPHMPKAYPWAGSLLVTWLMWYQLQPISVAIGWSLFGVLAFEIGALRKSESLQWQGYVALGASFIRIFFVNLNAECVPGRLSPQVYTVLPLAVIYFYVYWRATAADDISTASAARIRVTTLLSYLGSVSVAAVMRTELPLPWVATGWALLAFVLLAVAVVTGRKAFLAQSLIALGSTCFRVGTYNLDSLTDGRFLTTLAAVLGLIACLPMAFRLGSDEKTTGLPLIGPVMRRPEQAFFFLPVAVLTALLWLEFHGGATTLSWGLEGLAILVLALFAKERSFRLTGLALLMACVAKILFWDVWRFSDTGMKAIALISVGAILTLVAFLYSKYKDVLREYL